MERLRGIILNDQVVKELERLQVKDLGYFYRKIMSRDIRYVDMFLNKSMRIRQLNDEDKADFKSFMKALSVFKRKDGNRIKGLGKVLKEISKKHFIDQYLTRVFNGESLMHSDYIMRFRQAYGRDFLTREINECIINDMIPLCPPFSLGFFKLRKQFNNADAIVFDYETTLIANITQDIEAILFSAVDTRNGEVITDLNRLISVIDGRLLVAHNIKFDVHVLIKELMKLGWEYDSEKMLLASSQNEILKVVCIRKENELIEFGLWDTMNVFAGMNLYDVGRAVDEFISVYEGDCFLVKEYKKLGSGKGLVRKCDETKFLQIASMYPDAKYNIDSGFVYAMNDVAVKCLLETLGENPKDCLDYILYNLKDVYITAIAFKHFAEIFRRSILPVIEGFDFDIRRRFTISSLSFSIVKKICQQNVIDKLKSGMPLEMFNHYECQPPTSERHLLVDAEKQIYKSIKGHSVIIKDGNKWNGIIFTEVDMKFKEAYSGGIVYFRDNLKYEANDKVSICGYDINSSYPKSIEMTGVEPYSSILEAYPYEIDKIYAYADKCQKNEHSLEIKNRIINLFSGCRIFSDYPELIRLIHESVLGNLNCFVEGVVRYVPRDTTCFGMIMSVKTNDGMRTANAIGITQKKVLLNVLDLLHIDSEIMIDKLYILQGGNNKLSSFMTKCYALRNQYKSVKDAREVTIKLFLNTAYGKFGSCPKMERSEKFVCSGNIGRKAVFRSFIGRPRLAMLFDRLYDSGEREIDGNGFCNKARLERKDSYLEFMTENKNVVRRYKMFRSDGCYKFVHYEYGKKQDSSGNLLCAANITANSRLLLGYYKIINERKGCELLYSDTDSLYFLVPNAVEVETGTQLGDLKLENKPKFFQAFGKKLYVTNTTVKCKGVNKEGRRELLASADKISIDGVMVNSLQFSTLNSGRVFDLVKKKVMLASLAGLTDVTNMKVEK